MARYALFGSSYIARLGRYCNHSLDVPGTCRFFGKGGMRSDRIPQDILQELIDYRPDIVFIHLGGNDISTTSNPQDIFDRLAALVDQLKFCGAKHVLVAEVITRGQFRKSPGLTKLDFDVQRLKINRLLRKKLGGMFVHFNYEVLFPVDYDNDLVHIGAGRGMRRYLQRIHEVLRKCPLV